MLNPPPRFFCQIPWSQNVHQIFCRHIHRFHWYPYFVPPAPQKKTGTLAGVNTNPARNTRGSLPPPFWGASNIIYPSPSSDSSPPQKMFRRETPNSLGSRKSMCQIQATVAMEQKQIRLDIAVTAAAGTCFGTRSNAMSTHQDPIPEPRTRTSKGSAKDRERMDLLYIEDLRRSSYKNFLGASQKNFQTSTNVEHLQDSRCCCKDILRRISAGSPQDLLTRTCTRSCKDT